MRIIAGTRRGRALFTGRAAGFRPTSDRVREAIFDVLAEEVAGRNVLDLFAGSGALGFEALSRGASSVLFVEKNRRVAAWIERNARELRFEAETRVASEDVLRFLKRPGGTEGRDLVFVDPPYGAGLVAPALEALAGSPRCMLTVLERDKREAAPPAGAPWRGASSYGDTVIEYFLIGGGQGETR